MNSDRVRDVEIASQTDVGRVRSANQDVCGAFENADGYRLLVVADGMGGHAGGETASRLALELIRNTFEREFGDPDTLLARAFRAANEAVHRTSASDSKLRGMGTTGVAILLGPRDRGWVANVGDSRAYRLREGRFDQITEDQSWVGEELRHGRITAEEALGHPMKNVLLQSIGVDPEVEIAVTPIDLEAGDRYLLCSDGLWGEVDDRAITEVLTREAPARAVAALVDLANENGGSDNVTVVVAALLEAATPPAAAIGSDPPIAALSGRHRDPDPNTQPATANAFPRGVRPLWAKPGVVVASLIAAFAIVWRLCA